jgi:hypothetical protein
MAKEPSFLGIIERLKKEGDLDRNRGNNSIKSLIGEIVTSREENYDIGYEIQRELNDIEVNTSLAWDTLFNLKESIVGNDLAKAEKEREQLDLFEEIGENIEESNDLAKAAAKEKPKEEKNFFAKLLGIFPLIGTKIAATFSKIPGFKFLSKTFGKLGSFLSKTFGKGSFLGKTFGKLGSFLSKTFGKSGFLGKLFGGSGALGKMFGFLGKIFLKLSVPLTLAFGAFKGIVESIKGYKEGGIMGAIEGFFKGAFEGIVGDLPQLVGGLIQKFLGIFGFEKYGEMINNSIVGIVDNFKGFFVGIFDAVKALFSGDTPAFQEALGKIWESVKNLIIGDEEGGGLFGILKTNILLISKELLPRILSFLTETVFPLLKEIVFPKVMEIAGNVAKVLSETFMDFLAIMKEKIMDLIPDIGGGIKKGLGKVKGLFGFGGDEDEELPEGIDSSKFNESQKEALTELNNALSEEDDLEKRLALIREFDAKRKRQMSDEDREDEEFVNAVRLVTTSSFDKDDEKEMILKRGPRRTPQKEREIVSQPSNSGAQMEGSMSNIADSKAQPAPVIVAGGGGGGAAPQNTTVNSSNVNISNSRHAEESWSLTTAAYGF